MKARHQMKIRVPDDIKKYIEEQSKENACSQTSEVVRAIRAAMKEKGVTEVAASSRHVEQSQLTNGDHLND